MNSHVHDKEEIKWVGRKASEYCNIVTKGKEVDEINQLNRDKLLQEFIKFCSISVRFREKGLSTEPDFLEDVKKELDYKLVRGYWKNKTQKPASELKTWKIEGTGLIYQFKENYDREQIAKEEKTEYKEHHALLQATSKQLKYVNDLLFQKGFSLTPGKKKSLTMEEAGILIESLKKDENIPEEFVKHVKKEYFIYTKESATKEVRNKTNKSFPLGFFDFIIKSYEIKKNIGGLYTNGTNFSKEFIEFLVQEFEDGYGELVKDFEKSQSKKKTNNR